MSCHRLLPSGIEIEGWTITSRKGPILNSHDRDVWSNDGLHGQPEMLYGHNFLQFSKPSSSFSITFNPQHALRGCLTNRKEGTSAPPHYESKEDVLQAVHSKVEVPAAKLWSKKHHAPEVHAVDFGYDWTFATSYQGSVENGSVEETGDSIPIARLTARNPILWYDEVQLWEDELHDNGVSWLLSKVRVMPSCWFALLRCYIRVDGVLVRICDTRLFHSFDSDFILREYSVREDTFDSLLTKGFVVTPEWQSDPMQADIVLQHLPVVAQSSARIQITGRS